MELVNAILQDSTLSEKVVKLIKDSVRERNIPCLLSIHQPRSSIFRMLDDIILLAPGGRVIYHGKSQDAIKYFKKIGFDCPTQTNPAEFLIDLVSVDSEDFDKAFEDELRILKLVEAFKDHQKSIKFTRHLNACTSSIYNKSIATIKLKPCTYPILVLKQTKALKTLRKLNSNGPPSWKKAKVGKVLGKSRSMDNK